MQKNFTLSVLNIIQPKLLWFGLDRERDGLKVIFM